MKKLILLFSLILSFNSCNQNEEEKINDNSIIGTWKLIEEIESGIDGLPVWTPIEESESYTYTFYDDGTILNSKNNCDGTYVLNLSTKIINIKYYCDASIIEGNFKLTIDNNNLILSPNPNPCDEGCAKKFKKVEK